MFVTPHPINHTLFRWGGVIPLFPKTQHLICRMREGKERVGKGGEREKDRAREGAEMSRAGGR